MSIARQSSRLIFMLLSIHVSQCGRKYPHRLLRAKYSRCGFFSRHHTGLELEDHTPTIGVIVADTTMGIAVSITTWVMAVVTMMAVPR